MEQNATGKDLFYLIIILVLVLLLIYTIFESKRYNDAIYNYYKEEMNRLNCVENNQAPFFNINYNLTGGLIYNASSVQS